MAKSLKILSAVIIGCLVLLDQQVIPRVAGDDEYYQEINEEGAMLTTENHHVYPGDTTATTEITVDTTDAYTGTSEFDSNAVEVEPDDADEVIELNVGGQRITTLLSTLTAVPSSILAQMFSKTTKPERVMPRDKNGAVVLDYNPAHFEYLLDQLRMIKRMPQKPAYELNITPPAANAPSNFSYMIKDLGLNPERFLYPLAGAHLNMNISSLVGWKECHRSRYDQPFDRSVYFKACANNRVLVACRPVGNRKTLTLLGTGAYSDVFGVCPAGPSCISGLKNGIGFYYDPDRSFGFHSRPENYAAVLNAQHQYRYQYGYSESMVTLNPCDSSDHFSDYRLCWSFRSAGNRGGGDRCGSVKDLHNGTGWERVIYVAV